MLHYIRSEARARALVAHVRQAKHPAVPAKLLVQRYDDMDRHALAALAQGGDCVAQAVLASPAQ